jgi:hypothetical protein
MISNDFSDYNISDYNIETPMASLAGRCPVCSTKALTRRVCGNGALAPIDGNVANIRPHWRLAIKLRD